MSRPEKDHQDRTLVILAHGSRSRADVMRHLDDVCERLTKETAFAHVYCATMQGGASVSEIAQRIRTKTVIVVPFLMSNGPLAHTMKDGFQVAMQDALPNVTVFYSLPVGVTPEVTDIVEQRIDTALASTPYDRREINTLLVGHGAKKSANSREATEEHVRRLASRNLYKSVSPVFLEEPPFLSDMLSTAQKPVAVIGLFAAPGMHAIDDLTEALAPYEDLDVIDAGFIGADETIVSLIEACAEAAKPQKLR